MRFSNFRRVETRLQPRGRRSGYNRMPKTPIISPRDLNTCRITGTEQPPENTNNPPISKKVRVSGAYTGSAYTWNGTPNAIALEDGNDYLGSGTLRYTTLRIERAEVWLGLSAVGTGQAPLLSITDGYSQVVFSDQPNLGVDYAHVAMRPSLFTRTGINTTSNTSTNLVIVDIPAAEGYVGTVVIDLTVTMQ